jgi:hypothetical protein
MKAYKYSETTLTNLSDLKETEIYKAIESAEAGNLQLLKDMYQAHSYGIERLLNGKYMIHGWVFDISEFCKTYLAREEGSDVFYKYKAPSKPCLRKAISVTLEEIHQIKK